MIKLKKIFKMGEGKVWTYEFEDYLRKLGICYEEGEYKLSVSRKFGKRRKIKKMKIRYWSQYCECCGRNYYAEFIE